MAEVAERCDGEVGRQEEERGLGHPRKEGERLDKLRHVHLSSQRSQPLPQQRCLTFSDDIVTMLAKCRGNKVKKGVQFTVMVVGTSFVLAATLRARVGSTLRPFLPLQEPLAPVAPRS